MHSIIFYCSHESKPRNMARLLPFIFFLYFQPIFFGPSLRDRRPANAAMRSLCAKSAVWKKRRPRNARQKSNMAGSPTPTRPRTWQRTLQRRRAAGSGTAAETDSADQRNQQRTLERAIQNCPTVLQGMKRRKTR